MVNDVRTACRRLLQAPLFTVSAIAIIAVAIGANTAIFGVADAVLFRPLPYADPARVFVLRTTNPYNRPGGPSMPVPSECLEAIERYHRGIAAVGERGSQSMTIHVGGQAEWLAWTSVSPDYFRALGVRPWRGRLFDADDTAEPWRIAVLSYDCWQRLFSADEAVVGQPRKLGSETRDVIGVLAPGFVFPSVFMTADRFGISGRPDFVTARRPATAGGGGDQVIDPIVRLKLGVTREQAQAEMDALLRPIKVARAKPGSVQYLPVLEDVRSTLLPAGRAIMAWLLVAAGLVVLVGCANLAIMFLARTRRREPDIGVQMALGATRWRIVRPILVEALIIGFAGAWAGVLVAYLTFGALLRQVPPVVYGGARVGIDIRVIAFALALGLGSGLLFGVAPAWRAAGLDVQALIQGRPGRAGRARRVLARPLITAQVALATALVFGAIIAGRAFLSVLRTPLGFDPDKVVTLRVDPPDDVRVNEFYRRAVEALARRPDVVAAGAVTAVPLGDRGPANVDENQLVGVEFVLPGYFETIGARLVRGRLPGWDDFNSGARISVVSQSAGRALFPGLDPLGRTFRLKNGPELSIVGVVSDIRKYMDGKGLPSAFALPDNESQVGMSLVARMRGRGTSTLSDVRRGIGRLSPTQPVVAAWWTDAIDALVPFRNPRLQALVLGTFAALALGLNAVGIFAVVSFLVAARRREIGVRLALGAAPRALVHMTVRQALWPVVAGSLLGLVVTRWLSGLVEAQLYAADAHDPVTLAVAIVTVVLAATTAAYLPARAASKIDPAEVLRAS